MTSSSLGWQISIIKPAIDRCLRLCGKYSDETHGVFPSSNLTKQLERLDSVYQKIQSQPNVAKIYINLEAILKELGECQVFLNGHRASRRPVPTDPELLSLLESHTQRLDVYRFLLGVPPVGFHRYPERPGDGASPEFPLVRRATLPNPELPLVNPISHETEALDAELDEVKKLRASLSATRFPDSHRHAAKAVDEELARIAIAFQDQISRSQNRARLQPFSYNYQQPNFVVDQDAPTSPSSIQTHSASVVHRTGSVSSTSSGVAPSLDSVITSLSLNGTENPTHEYIDNVKIRFRVGNNSKQNEVLCDLKATSLEGLCVKIAVLPKDEGLHSIALPELHFRSSSNRPIPIRRWRGNRTEEGDYDLVVTLSSLFCLQTQTSLSDLEFRFHSEPACKAFQAMVYGKELSEFVNVHKLQREDTRRRRVALCESSVIYFWQHRSSSAPQMADYTMLYLENNRPNRPIEVQLRYFLLPGPSSFGNDVARLQLGNGSASFVFEFSGHNGRRDLQKLRNFFKRLGATI